MRALARWGIAPLMAAPLGAWALGLGDIELHSALNQPFQAKIGLVATPEELQGLKVALASPETFQRYGIDRPGFLSRLDFRVLSERNGQATIDVSSRESITEPFVTILVEATWARGRRLREYTVLLDPPVLLPAPAAAPAVQPAQTRPAAASPGGAINRPPQPAPTPPPARPQPVQPPTSNNAPPAPRTPAAAPGGSYGPVQRSETLWAIAERFRSDGVTMNQMMVAVYRANPQAFAGNMNVLLVGSTLRMPEASEFQELSASVANGEFQRQNDEWQNRPAGGRLRLVPTETAVASRGPGTPAPAPAVPAPAPAVPAPATPATRPATNGQAPAAPAPGDVNVDDNRRPLEVRSPELQNLQQQAANQNSPPAAAPAPAAGEPPVAAPGVDLDNQVFKQPEEAAVAEPAPAAPAAPTPVAAPSSPSLTSQILAWVMSPILWIGLGVAALLITALLFVRRKRQEPEDVTGRWEALESQVDDEEAREATERMRRQLPEESIVVEESAQPRRNDVTDDSRRPAPRAPRAAPPADETLSSQTVINLDQADPVAEADFHMAYGLYDQAAELVQKALEAAPDRRDLKLKLLEVFFVWGNKDAFLSAAQSLRKEIGQRPDSDWDKVVIMGKQICPDERLFAEATSSAGTVDVDLEAGGDAPLDLAFDEASAGGLDMDLGDAGGLDFDLDSSGTRRPQQSPPARVAAGRKTESEDDLLDIGERTAAGLEAALFAPTEDDADEDTGRRTTPDLAADESLEVTQESPTIESPRGGNRGAWDTVAIEGPTQEYALDAPTVETPTIETPSAEAPTMETPTIETRHGHESPTIEQPGLSLASLSDRTAEIKLDDLGLDIKDLEGLPTDLGDLPVAQSSETDTREQPALGSDDDELLSATGVTQVLRGEDDDDLDQRKTSVLDDEDATLLAPGYGEDNTLTGTEVLDQRFAFDTESGDTSLVKSLREEDNLDLNLDDLSAALQGADTVEQPRSSPFSNDIFGGGDTPIDLDVGKDVLGGDDPTGTEEASPLDPQTMTEVGTKLDLARAYIDMGDPEGARSILEEVLDEGDPNQRREAQGLIDVLSA